MTTTGRRFAPLLLLPLLASCSWLDQTFPDKSQDYKRAEPTQSLEIPPDLTTTPTTDALVVPSGPATLSGYTNARESLGKQSAGAVGELIVDPDALSFERDKDRAWLVVKGEPSSVWPVAREFWIEDGFFIMREDPALGTLETDWKENRAAIPQDPIRRLIGRVYDNAYSSSYRDRYRMRLERGEKPGTTEVFISHQGVEEILVAREGDGDTKWGPRPADPAMESEMLKRMMIFMGMRPEQAEQQLTAEQPRVARAELIQPDGGQATLVIRDDFDKAWRNVGIVLDRVGFAVEDRDRIQGLYYVRYNDPLGNDKDTGLLSKLAFWSSDDEQVENYQILLSDDGADTRVVVLNEAGDPDQSITAVRILNLLYDELK
jgi:outer membrane protein assembly factor BamC